jgi:hypothetical protein
VIEHLLKTRLTPVNGEEMYEDLLDECYPEVRIGDSFFSPSRIIKELDPVCFNMGVTENLDSLAEDGLPLRLANSPDSPQKESGPLYPFGSSSISSSLRFSSGV